MKLYLICGKSHHGKDELAKLLKNQIEQTGQKVTLLQITEPLYTLARNHFGWDGQAKTKPRRFLQTMGIEIIAQKLQKPNYLLDHLQETIEILDLFFDVGIITDGRLRREVEILQDRYPDLVTIHIVRPCYDSQLTEEEGHHITECDLDSYHNFTYEVVNTSLKELEKSAERISQETSLKGEM